MLLALAVYGDAAPPPPAKFRGIGVEVWGMKWSGFNPSMAPDTRMNNYIPVENPRGY